MFRNTLIQSLHKIRRVRTKAETGEEEWRRGGKGEGRRGNRGEGRRGTKGEGRWGLQGRGVTGVMGEGVQGEREEGVIGYEADREVKRYEKRVENEESECGGRGSSKVS